MQLRKQYHFAGSANCLLVQPKFSAHSFWNYTEVCALAGAKYPAAPLGLLTVAALLPAEWNVRLVDENVKALSDEDLAWADVVMTGGMLPQQREVLAIIARARRQNKAVVVGGPDPTSQPDIYKDADYLVLGEGEVTIPHLVAALARGDRGGVYTSSERADMARAVVPRFDLIDFSRYLHMGVQFSRGCPFNCEFCDVIELFGRRPRTKTAAQIIKELQTLYDLGYRGHVDFVDDNLIGNKKDVLHLLTAVRAWQKERLYPFFFSGEASLNLARDERLLELMRDIDFRYVFIGIETPEANILAKTQNHLSADVSLAAAVHTISSYGIIVNAGFILGFDNEDEHTGERVAACIQETGICMAMVGTLYALPNTQLTRRLRAEGRLFAGGVSRVDAAADVDQTSSGLNFVPSRARADILQDYVRVLAHIYAPANYFARVARTGAILRRDAKHRPPLRQKLRQLKAFARLCVKLSRMPGVGPLYWKTFFRFLFRAPRSLEAVVNLAAMYIHFASQSRFIIEHVERRIADIAANGDEKPSRTPRPASATRSAAEYQNAARAR